MDKIEQISNDVQALNAKVDRHIGNYGEEVHPLPEYGNAGFMPYDFYVKNKALFEDRKYVTKVDVGSLEPGFYYGNFLEGIPSDANPSGLALIDVTKYDTNRISIRCQMGSDQTIWIKNIHNPNSETPSRGWRRQLNMNILWSGKASTVGTTIKLADSKNMYSDLWISCEGIAGNAGFGSISAARSAFAIGTPNIPNDSTAMAASSEMTLEFSDDKTAKITKNKTVNVGESTGVIPDLMYITKIIGVEL
ncbi:hypothetical protein V4W88_08105 [Pediococcus acidilactici]|uniref:hypothetical protein n=1 Tax=Pediococcus acidilactici TaxID=1254 RepID=UPI002FBEA77E